jgi:hypothetical protein
MDVDGKFLSRSISDEWKAGEGGGDDRHLRGAKIRLSVINIADATTSEQADAGAPAFS